MMKKIFYTIIILFAGTVLYSCNEDILDKTPLDEISDPEFWNNETDLQLFLNNLYGELWIDSWYPRGSGSSPFADASSDIVVSDQASLFGVQNHQMDGTLSVPSTTSDWSEPYRIIRSTNYFLENAARVEASGLSEHYTGEGHFFRAYFYFHLLHQFGAVPIITQVVDTDEEIDLLYGPRNSRSEVTDFILSDLDMAISKMEFDAGQGRLNKDVALLFKARVALYAGTWEKYHQGTVFAGSTDGSGYIQQAAAAAQSVISNGNYSISMGTGPTDSYYRLFNQTDLSGNPEVLFYDHHDGTLGRSNQLDNWPGGMGVTQELVRFYLCTDGLPTGASPLFTEGDDYLLTTVEDNRDLRLAQTIMVPGDIVLTDGANGPIYFEFPDFNAPTGYESQKFRMETNGDDRGDVAFIFFRYAEALLIYAEAKAEMGQLTQADVDMSINLLRDRVGMPHLNLASITPDPNKVDYGYTMPDYLYEVRRERVIELAFEGRRINDLMRWRAHSLFLGKRPSGTFLTPALEAEHPGNFFANEDGFIDPYQEILTGPNGGYGFNPDRDYLWPLPSTELTLNTNLDQNPGW